MGNRNEPSLSGGERWRFEPGSRVICEIPCGESIASTRFPYFGSSRPEDRCRQVLGIVAVPPAFMRQVVPTRLTPWAYWRKQGLGSPRAEKQSPSPCRKSGAGERRSPGVTAFAPLAHSGLKAALRLWAPGTPMPVASSFVPRQHVPRSSSAWASAAPLFDSD